MTQSATAAERTERGRAVRSVVPRSSHGPLSPPEGRADPVTLLERQAVTRLPELVPIRYGRMAASPFAFLRGAAVVMAADLAVQPHTGLTVQLCGDAHLLNFGVFGSPERALLFDLNDFDETLPGPFEWDVKRLAASLAVAAGSIGAGRSQVRGTARACVRAYRESVRRLAAMGELAVWYRRIDTTELLPMLRGGDRRRTEGRLAAARRRNSVHAVAKLTEVRDGRRRIVARPPLITRIPAPDADTVHAILDDYRATLPEECRELLDRFRFVDAAAKVVGVGSVGTRCFVVLLQGRDEDDLLVLQLKEAERSVLEEHLPSGPHDHHGHRVVAGQKLMQAASDIFLGWTTGPGEQARHFYWRQLRDMKGSAEVESMTPRMLQQYGTLCGTALARAHARSGDRLAIAGYLGGGTVFDEAVADFAVRYAERNAADHTRLREAISTGTVEARTDV
ncbi:DUF2252 domain-containing protein [Kitasatospora sp. DSM 101779]|uniref:DUF2252 domain-containing protein n=1 Tax=Kitasatospora sp. DSM 101779 TaxID=2853165 RepID=UPI0021DB42BB|nr:DUF2252 domain-containing protein [Kitasatospora sp. DSM 101779]MCU7821669.1 DUF2252 domain-containing protein [Kitasatospora sp. DSM 101779]